MRESTATTTHRSPARKIPARNSSGRTAGAFTTRGATALAPQRVPAQPAGPDGGAAGRARLRVAPPVPVAAPRAPFVALVLAVVVAGVMGILVLNTKINENAFQLSHLEDQQNSLDEREAQLNAQLADDSSPTNLYALARAQGMVPAGQPAYLTLPNGTVLGLPQPANGAPSVTSQQGGAAGQPAGAAGH